MYIYKYIVKCPCVATGSFCAFLFRSIDVKRLVVYFRSIDGSDDGFVRALDEAVLGTLQRPITNYPKEIKN